MTKKQFEKVLSIHSKAYPLMEKEDLLKLIYQLTFGPNHLISIDQSVIQKRLLIEASNNNIKEKEAVYIGNNLYRISLYNNEQYLLLLSECFIKTCHDFKKPKNIKLFKKYLDISINYLSLFPNIIKDDYISFINQYLTQEITPISHSFAYKEAYKPSYRIVSKKYIKYLLR